MTNIKNTLFLLLLTFISFTVQAALSDHFVTTWKTDNPGSSNDTSITIFTNSYNSTYAYDVDWDNDGVFDEFAITGDVTHDFGVAGEKTIRIKGSLPAIQVGNDSEKIISIDQWGTNPWQSMVSSFEGALNLSNKATDTPNLSNCFSLSGMFSGARLIGAGSENSNWNWDTSSVTNMDRMFSGAFSFNQTIDGWDISNVTSMASMFTRASSFNQPLNNWDTSSVEWFGMSEMFSQAASFNQDLSSWDTSSVVSMLDMFNGATLFNQNLGEWNVENVVLFDGMLNGVRLSIANYDALLIGWYGQNLTFLLDFDAGSSIYCSRDAQAAHDAMVSTLSWNVSDGGACEDTLNILTKSIVFDENTVQLFKIAYSDPNSDTANFALTGGEDIGMFTLDAITGEISFTNAPDFETPLDIDGDNAYLVEVKAMDDGAPIETDTQLIKIYINNVEENLTSEHFVTTWNSENISIGTNGNYFYNYNVDWDNDGIFDELNVRGDISHIYSETGNHTIRISGEAPQFFLRNSDIVSVDQWGSIAWTSMENMFEGADNLVLKTQDIPNLFNVTSLNWMFSGALSVGGDLDTGNWNWQTPTVTGMRGVFSGAISFNQDLSNWETSNVLDMASMFRGAILFNQALGNWDTGNVRSMGAMFSNATSFNKGIGNWDTGNVSSMGAMFSNATSFNKGIGNWDTSSVTDMYHMFFHSTSFNQIIGNWDTSDVNNMSGMFSSAISFDQAIGNWDTSNVTDMKSMFSSATSFNQNISSWKTSKVYDMTDMFNGAISFDQNLGGWNVEDGRIDNMFRNNRLSVANYDALLIGWSVQNLFSGQFLNFGETVYCSPAARLAHYQIVSILHLNIIDGGPCEDALKIITQFIVLDENTIQLFKIDYSDPNDDIPSFIISGGKDKDLFNLNSITGELSFNIPPDFENPMDANGDNVYLIEITVIDDGQPIETDTKLIEIYINNINENLVTDHFVTTWNTNIITIDTIPSFTYNYKVDWDNDGVFDEFHIARDISHDYGSFGTHTIRISGVFPLLTFKNEDSIISVDQWGSNRWKYMSSMFSGADNVVIKAQDTPNLFHVISLSGMFYLARSVGNNLDTGNWEWQTPTVTSISSLFQSATSFNKDIRDWNTSSVTSMHGVFKNATSFNQDIGNWDTSRVTDMDDMFFKASSFNQAIGNWNTSSLNNTDHMFFQASLFDQDISSWDTSRVTDMSNMFDGAISFNQNLGSWNVENVNYFQDMFYNVRLTVGNYDALLIQWNKQNLSIDERFNAGTSIYCSQAAQAAHDNITSTFYWTITDGGICAPYLAIVSDANISVDENHTAVIKVLTTEPDFDTPTFSVTGGADELLFSIDSTSGLLFFIDQPDFETPLSANNSNVYEVEVTAIDDGIPQEFASQLITVSVNDLIESSPIDLIVTATADISIVNLGDTIVYTVVVSNNGSEDAVNAYVYDLHPAEFVGSTWTCVATGAAICTISGTGEIADIVFIPNDGSTLTYTVTAIVSTDGYLQSSYQFFVDSNEPQYDTDLSNNAVEVMLLTPLIFKNGFD